MAEVESISHSGICVHDLKEAEDFYCNVLGAEVHSRVNFKTQDALRGRSIHTTLTLDDYVFAVMLTEDWMVVPEPGQLRGGNRTRHSFCVPKARFPTVLEMRAASGCGEVLGGLHGGAIILLRVGPRLDGRNGLGVGWQLVLLSQAILGSQRVAGQTKGD